MHLPSVSTKTWIHTDVCLGCGHIFDFFAGLLNDHDNGDYYRGPGLTDAQAKELLLSDPILPSVLTLDEEREADVGELEAESQTLEEVENGHQ